MVQSGEIFIVLYQCCSSRTIIRAAVRCTCTPLPTTKIIHITISCTVGRVNTMDKLLRKKSLLREPFCCILCWKAEGDLDHLHQSCQFALVLNYFFQEFDIELACQIDFTQLETLSLDGLSEFLFSCPCILSFFFSTKAIEQYVSFVSSFVYNLHTV